MEIGTNGREGEAENVSTALAGADRRPELVEIAGILAFFPLAYPNENAMILYDRGR